MNVSGLFLITVVVLSLISNKGMVWDYSLGEDGGGEGYAGGLGSGQFLPSLVCLEVGVGDTSSSMGVGHLSGSVWMSVMSLSGMGVGSW